MSAPHTMTDRARLWVAGGLAVVSIAALLIPLVVIVTPLVGNLTGFFTVGITATSAGLRFVGLAGMFGGAGLVGSIWLMTSVRRKP